MTNFPSNPFEILDPSIRWVPSREELQEKAYEQLLPPLVHKVRLAVKQWRDKNYDAASETSKALLNFWFNTEHHLNNGNAFRFYFAQREAIESIIYLYEVAVSRDKYELLRYDSSEHISTGMFPENWCRYVIKMATGTGKTKVLTLALIWSYFHKLYENNSTLSQNFLVIAPNIIVLNRLRKDFDNLKVFKEEPLIPDNGFNERNWQNDFQITLHIQDELKPITSQGNIFLTNIHRVFLQDDTLTLEEEFLGKKPKPDSDKAKGMDLGEVLRSSKIKDLVVFNDEAHHIHDESLAWFQNIQDVSNQLKLKQNNGISLQVDFTATPKHQQGGIFAQTICDYPLVEAIWQNVVKSPVLPDEASRAKLEERTSTKFVEQYRDYIELGYQEWEEQFNAYKKAKTPLLFIMTNNTKEGDETKDFLELNYPKLKGHVLLIHTNKSGEISENVQSKRAKEELEKLRKAADNVDKDHSQYRAVVSVMMLREGWDVKNVTTIVGLRPYVAPGQILPEQTLGRGVRKMFDLDVKEELVVLGTPAFIEFVESIKTEGVQFNYRPMGKGVKGKSGVVVEPDKENKKKDLENLDIPIPVLTPRVYREYKNIENLNVNDFSIKPVELKQFNEKELKEITFTDLDGKFSHTIEFKDSLPDYRNVIGFFTQNILKQCRLISGFHILYPKVETFIENHLFGKKVKLDDPQTLRNLSEIKAKQTIFNTFKEAIDKLTVSKKGTAAIKNFISLRKAKPFVVNKEKFIHPQKSVFNKITGDSDFELKFAAFLDKCDDIISFTKNHQSLNIRIEYQGEDGNIHDFYPDFFIKQSASKIYVAETKGREDEDDKRKIQRLITWCNDINNAQDQLQYEPLYIKDEKWNRQKDGIKNFNDVIQAFNIAENVPGKT